MTTTFRKLTNASRSSWTGQGMAASTTAATYGVYEDDVHVATIERRGGGGYRDASEWIGRRLNDGLIVAFASTLKAAKAQCAAKPVNSHKPA